MCRDLHLLKGQAREWGRVDWAVFYARAYLYHHRREHASMAALQRRWTPSIRDGLLRDALSGAQAGSVAADEEARAEAAAGSVQEQVQLQPRTAQIDTARPRVLPYFPLQEDDHYPDVAARLLEGLDKMVECRCGPVLRAV